MTSNIVKPKVIAEETESFSFPFTPTKPGICMVSVNPSSTSASFLEVTRNGKSLVFTGSGGGVGHSCTFGVEAGITYSLGSSSTNYGTLKTNYMALTVS